MPFRTTDEQRIAITTRIVEQRIQNPHKSRQRYFKRGKGERIVAFKTDETHPGRGNPLNVIVATWNPATNNYDNYASGTVKAIDWRKGVPTPGKCATGWGWWRSSNAYGRIIYIGDLDCITPGC